MLETAPQARLRLFFRTIDEAHPSLKTTRPSTLAQPTFLKPPLLKTDSSTARIKLLSVSGYLFIVELHYSMRALLYKIARLNGIN